MILKIIAAILMLCGILVLLPMATCTLGMIGAVHELSRSGK